MWVLISRAPREDAAYWPGRRLLAMLDAVAWPMLWAVAVIKAPFSTVAARRTHRAVFRNERYWFTIWRWGLALAGLAAVGAATKLNT